MNDISLSLNKLAGTGQWDRLITRSEEVISSKEAQDEDKFTARLWWVKGHLALNMMPVTIIAAPLDSVSKEIISKMGVDPEFKGGSIPTFASEVLIEISRALSDKKEEDLALTFIERAYRIDPQYGELLLSTALRVAQKIDLSRAKRKDDPLFRKKDRVDAIIAELKKKRVFKESKESEQKNLVEDFIPPASAGQKKGYFNRRSIISTIIGFSVIGVAYGSFFKGPSNKAGTVSKATSNSVFPEPSLHLPSLDRIAGVTQLDAIYYDLEQSKKTLIPINGDALPGKEEGKQAPISRDINRQGGRKEIVNTQTPVEPPDLYREFQKGSQPDRGSEVDVRDLFPEFKREREAKPSTTAESYFRPSLYRIRVKTYVMSRPDDMGVRVSDLIPGDRVKGEGRIGDWLIVTSKGGNKGYVYIRDTEPFAE